MKISIQWRCDYQELPVADGVIPRVKLEKPEWRDFAISDVIGKSRNTVIGLFIGGPPVRAKQGVVRITNRQEIKDGYLAEGVKCILFSELAPSEGKLSVVGLV